MNRQEAAEVLTELKQRLEISDDDDYYHYSRDIDAYDTALTALRGWVKTADRVPTAEDANNNLCVLAKVAKDGTVKEVRFEELSWIEWGGAYYFSHWMKLPEVEG